MCMGPDALRCRIDRHRLVCSFWSICIPVGEARPSQQYARLQFGLAYSRFVDCCNALPRSVPSSPNMCSSMRPTHMLQPQPPHVANERRFGPLCAGTRLSFRQSARVALLWLWTPWKLRSRDNLVLLSLFSKPDPQCSRLQLKCCGCRARAPLCCPLRMPVLPMSSSIFKSSWFRLGNLARLEVLPAHSVR